MSAPKFTPGPWRWRVDDENSMTLMGDGDREEIAFFSRRSDSPVGVNRLLIAAAPELYSTLEDVLRLLPAHREDEPSVVAARAALAKARGEQPEKPKSPLDAMVDDARGKAVKAS